MKLEALHLNCFHRKFFFGDDGFQNMFVYQPTFNMLELKIDIGTEYVTGWKSKALFESKASHFIVLSYLT